MYESGIRHQSLNLRIQVAESPGIVARRERRHLSQPASRLPPGTRITSVSGGTVVVKLSSLTQ
jgi:hypothetical protein